VTHATRDAAPVPESLPRPYTPRREPGGLTAPRGAPLALETSPAIGERRLFPGWRWVAVAVAFPIAGYMGWKLGGRVDAVGAALVGGALTGAGLGAVQWWAAKGALGRAAAWIGASAVGYAVGLAAGGALVFMLLSGLLLARFTAARSQAA
jgi:hypothetical protein